MEKKNFRYYAFISYAHEDEKWAEWLQKEVENYKLPTTIHKDYEKDIPKKVRPLFRDISDLAAGGDLDKILKEELNNSNYLIVICSPRSAKSEWVNNEIQHFIDMGREDRIIPFIIEGKPNVNEGDDKIECFPPALKGRHILGAAVDNASGLGNTDNSLSRKEIKKQKEIAKLKVIAGLLNVKLDVLIKRHEQAERIRKIRLGIALAFTAAILAVAGYFTYDYNVTKVNYYEDYIDINGIAQGINEIREDDRNNYQYTYKITNQQFLVQSIERVDYNDELLADELYDQVFKEVEMKPAKIEYLYTGRIFKEELSTAIYYSANDKPIVELYYFDNDTIHLKRIGPDETESNELKNIPSDEKYQMKWSVNMIQDMSLNNYEEQVLSYVTGFELQYDSKGRLEKRYYINSNMLRDNIVNDIRHISGEKYEYDSKNRITKISFINNNGDNTYLFDSKISYITFEYQKNETQVSYFDIDDECIKGDYCTILAENTDESVQVFSYYNYKDDLVGKNYKYYDNNSRLNKEIFAGEIFDEDSCNTKLYFYNDSRLEELQIYDGEFIDDRHLVKQETKDDLYKPFIKYKYFYDDDDKKIAEEKYKDDELEYKKEIEYYNNNYLKTELYEMLDENTKITYEYEYGTIKKLENHDANGDLTESLQGYAVKEYSYNKLGNLTEIVYEDSSGELIDSNLGYAKLECSYDIFGRLMSSAYTSRDGHLVQGDGYMTYEAETNKNDVIVKEEFYGYIDGSQEVVKKEIEYDYNGRLFAYTYTDESDNLVPVGEASRYYANIEDGSVLNETFTDYFPADFSLLPYLINHRIKHVTVGYDNNHNIEELLALDSEGDVVLGHEYENGVISSAILYNYTTPVKNIDVPICYREYNDEGKMTIETYREENGDLMMGDYSVAVENVYKNGSLKERTYYYYSSSYYGLVRRYVKTYDERGFVSKVAYYNDDDELINKVEVDRSFDLTIDGEAQPDSDKSFLEDDGDECTTIRMKIIDGNGDVIIDDRYNFNKEELSVADALVYILDENNIDIVLDGEFISEIGGLGNKSEIAWNYQVNGDSPYTYATRYILKDNDEIVWRYLIYSEY